MKVSLEWLSQFVDGPLDAQVVADTLTLGGFPVEHIETVGPDTVLDVEVTSNRPDCLSVIGVAREVAALLGRAFSVPAIAAFPSDAPPPVEVFIEDTSLCPHLAMRLVRGVKVGPSPAWMQRRLTAVGQRPINNLVDITNYVLMEMGKPLHVFDAAKVEGGAIGARKAKEGEVLVTIGGAKQKLEPWMLVIADGVKPLGLAGIMGGEHSGVTAQTVDVLIESARFDPMTIRRTARHLAMASDSSHRFERGLDPTSVGRGADRAVELILQLAGGTVIGPLVQVGSTGHPGAKASLRLSRLRDLLGVVWTTEQCVAALSKLDLTPHVEGDVIEVSVPSHRLDVKIEEDVIEEVARVVGYDQIPLREEVSVRLTAEDPKRATTDLIRRTLTAAGYFEALTFSFVSDALAQDFRHASAATLHKVDSSTRRADAQLRPSILPNLLESQRHNEDVGASGAAKLFEIASTFWLDAAGKSVEERKLAMVGGEDFGAMRGAVELVLNRLDATRPVEVQPATRAGFGKQACGEVLWGGQSVGFVGRADRAVVEKVGLGFVPAMAELSLEPLLAGAVHVPQLTPLPRFPAVRRDLSLLVGENVRYAAIEQVIRASELSSLESVEHVTTYRGKPLEKGTKSVTIALAFRRHDGTLTGEQVDRNVSRVVEAAKEKLGATLRG